MSVQGQRGRKVVRNNRSSLTTFYMVIGGALILILGFGIVYALRSRTSSDARAALTAQIGRTAEGYYYKGSPDAPIKVVEYADYQCPGCGEFDRTLAPLIDRDYVATGKVQFIYHELPLTSIHPNAQAAAEAARCAGDQDSAKFWQMHDMLYLNQEQWSLQASPQSTFSSYAGQLELNRSAFDTCLSNGTNTAAIQAAIQAAATAGFNSTPTFDVNGQIAKTSELASTIDATLRSLQQSAK